MPITKLNKGLTPEQKLDIALTFLTQENRGSYIYPEVIQLEAHLTSKGIDEKEHWPIIFHLGRGKYVDLFYRQAENKLRGVSPNQVKVTFKGIKFIHKGGFTKLLKREKRKEKLEFWTKLLTIPTFIIGVGTFVILFYRKPSQTPIIIKYPDDIIHKLDSKIDSAFNFLNSKDSIPKNNTICLPKKK